MAGSIFFMFENILILSFFIPTNMKNIVLLLGICYSLSGSARLFPKGGSFLGELRGKKGEFEEIKRMVDSLARLRMAELEQIREATPEFRDLEKARIIADIANSYITYPSYCSIKEIRGKEEYDRFIQKITPELMQQIPLVNEERYLDVAVVRDVINRAMETPSLAEQLQFPLRTRELFKAGEYAYQLDSEVNPQVIKEIEEYVNRLKNEDIKTVLQAKLASIGSLLKGSPAIDLELTTPEGKTVHLSDFRGKVIYVDLWATWCGPCIAESPKFHELSERYKADNIVFLAISTDTNRKAWLNFIEGKSPVFLNLTVRILKI